MLRVLIADDDQYVHRCLNELIPWAELGFDVVGNARDGQEAYAMSLEFCPDVIISDIMMPVIDGGELLQRVTKIYAGVAFVFLSGYEDFRTAQLALKYSACDYILKPLSPEKIDALTDCLRRLSARLLRGRFYHELSYDPEEAERILDALRRRDADFFRRLFYRMALDAGNMDADAHVLRDATAKLMLLLLDAQDADEATRGKALDALSALRMKLDLIFHVSEAYFQFLGQSDVSYQGLAARIDEYIEANLADKALSVGEIAAQFHYSPDYANRLFTRAWGENLSGAISRKRLGRAAELLRNSRLPVDDVAAAVGYRAGASFARAFRRLYGATPSEYRQGG